MENIQQYFNRYSEIIDTPVYNLTASEADELVKLKWKFFALLSQTEYELGIIKQKIEDAEDDNSLIYKWQINEKTDKPYTENEIRIMSKSKEDRTKKIEKGKLISILEWNIKTIDSKVPIIRDWYNMPVNTK